jgi:hypothetical protein
LLLGLSRHFYCGFLPKPMLPNATPSFLQNAKKVVIPSLALLLTTGASAQTITGFLPATAPAGQLVIISGSHLNPLKSVTLNGQLMPIVGNPSANTVTVRVPAAAATGRMRLTTANGTVITSTKLGITRVSSAVAYGQVSANSNGATATNNFSTPAMGDIDGDGLIDMLVGQGDGTIKRFEQTGVNSTTFGTNTATLLKNNDATTTTAATTLDVGNFAKPTIADFDGDGLLELLVGEDTGNVFRYEQVSATGDNALVFNKYTLFANPIGTATSAAPNGGSYPRPTVADLDNNGLLDVLVGSNDGTLRRYEQTAANAVTFTTLGQMKLANGTVIDAGEVDKALLTDYNGDGYLDMLLGNKAGNIVLYTQSAANSATFTSLGALTTDGTNAISMAGAPSGYAAPAITDIDGDGLLDLFVGNGAGTVYRFQQARSATVPVLLPPALANPTPLPVVLTTFTGQVSAAGNVLRWATASETNNDHFEIERSTNGQDFVQIGRTAGAGSTALTHTYQFTDVAQPTISYYRLRQVDLDGTFSYSPVVTLAASSGAATAQASPSAYPSIFTETLYVAGAAGTEAIPATVALYSAAGQPVYSQALALSAAPQALSALPVLAPGLYILRLTTAAGTTTQRVSHQ